MILYQVDAFTSTPFTGNPAAVCLLDAPAEPDWMQRVAREMNLSETAFIVARPQSGHYGLRWFTPATEVDLCGHATLASAHLLWEQGHAAPERALVFHTLSGPLGARRRTDGQVVLDFPAEPPQPIEPPRVLLEALGVRPEEAGRNRMDLIVRLADAEAVRSLQPDLNRLAQVEVRGVIVTAASDDDVDFVSRFFAPRAGVLEDPVTGSAHCCLGPFWHERLGKADLLGYQASVRGGHVGVHVRGDRVDLCGHAVTVLRAELLV